MKNVALLTLFLAVCLSPVAANAQRGDKLPEQVSSAMRESTKTYRGYALNGGYVYYYSPDGKKRLGEGVATPTQIWVQPPGTPTVGLALLKAYSATGEKFYLDAATEAAEGLIYGQLESGAWTNSVDFDPQGNPGRYRNGKWKSKRVRNFSTLDDGISQAAIEFLIRADEAHDFKHKQIHESVSIALESLLNAQFPNGGFPQGWDEAGISPQPIVKANYPEYQWETEGRIKEYWDMYTLNDGVAGNVAQTLLTAWEVYKDPRYQAALVRLGDFLILAQMPDPQPAWAQQYNYQMQPIWARAFEPPGVSGRESQDAMRTLLTIYEVTGNEKYLEPIPSAIAYLKKSALPDGQLARYYALKTNRPLYMSRNGKQYSLTYDDSDLPSHYGWKVENHLDAINDKYRKAKRGDTIEDEPSDREREKRVREILYDRDKEGRWISSYQGEPLTGQPKFKPGEQYLNSEVFSQNLSELAEYLKRAQK